MSVDLERSVALTEQIARSDSPGETDRLQAERAQVDQRFDPEARDRGRGDATSRSPTSGSATRDLAVVSYHMGIGNLETVLRAYAGADDAVPIGELVAAEGLTYARGLLRLRARTHTAMRTSCSPDSATSPPTTCGRCSPRARIIALSRDDPDRLAETAELATNKATLEEVFHPESETEVFDDPGEIEDAHRVRRAAAATRSSRRSAGSPTRDIGELADELDQSPTLYRALRPEALATLTYMAGLVRELSGAATPLQVTQRGPRPRLPGPAGAVELRGDRRVLAAHDRLVVRHPARLRVQEAGAGVPVRARPAARARA